MSPLISGKSTLNVKSLSKADHPCPPCTWLAKGPRGAQSWETVEVLFMGWCQYHRRWSSKCRNLLCIAGEVDTWGNTTAKSVQVQTMHICIHCISRSWISIANIIFKDIFCCSASLAPTSSVRKGFPYGLRQISTEWYRGSCVLVTWCRFLTTT